MIRLDLVNREPGEASAKRLDAKAFERLLMGGLPKDYVDPMPCKCGNCRPGTGNPFETYKNRGLTLLARHDWDYINGVPKA